MTSSRPASLNLRGNSSLSLDERFSQLTQIQPQRMIPDLSMLCDTAPLVLLLHPGSAHLKSPVLSVNQFLRRWNSKRGSVWSRLGGLQVAQRRHQSTRKGFWSFRNKYRRSFRHNVVFKRRAQWRPLGRRFAGSSQRHQRPRRGNLASAATKRLGPRNAGVPSRKQLDAELDEYMSTTRSRLDKDLDQYMSLSKSRLDAELDEYMSLAGQSNLC